MKIIGITIIFLSLLFVGCQNQSIRMDEKLQNCGSEIAAYEKCLIDGQKVDFWGMYSKGKAQGDTLYTSICRIKSDFGVNGDIPSGEISTFGEQQYRCDSFRGRLVLVSN